MSHSFDADKIARDLEASMVALGDEFFLESDQYAPAALLHDGQPATICLWCLKPYTRNVGVADARPPSTPEGISKT